MKNFTLVLAGIGVGLAFATDVEKAVPEHLTSWIGMAVFAIAVMGFAMQTIIDQNFKVGG